MENIMITSTKRIDDFYSEKCKISLDDFNRLAHFALSLKPIKEDYDIDYASTYQSALERYFRENNDTSNELKETYDSIKDDMIVRMIFNQNLQLMLVRTDINDMESYNNYIKLLENYTESINKNEAVKNGPTIDNLSIKSK